MQKKRTGKADSNIHKNNSITLPAYSCQSTKVSIFRLPFPVIPAD